VPFDPQVLMQGLSISISGLLITFLTLGVFIFIMFGLQRLFPARHENEQLQMPIKPEPCAPVESSEEEEIAMAIATAIIYLRAESQQSLGKSLESGPGPLWTSRRIPIASPAVRSNRS
jgi:Na+-transporting methylmalonyl-CoA/oxaloacetate decarboxylase gamma subunit